MPFSVILHIGTDKTGTSSIQEFLIRNKKALSSRGFEYLHAPGRVEYRDLPSFCMDENRSDGYLKEKRIDNQVKRLEFKQAFLAEFHHAISQVPAGTHTLVISSEHLWSTLHNASEILALKQLISMYAMDVTIICYLREQSEKVVSNYSTRIKSGGTLGFSEHVAGFLKSGRNDYFKRLKIWESVFGRNSIHLRIFEKSFFHEGDLLSDFTHSVLGDFFGELDARIYNKNISLSPLGAVLARWVNKILPRDNNNETVQNLNRLIIAFLGRNFTGQLSLLSDTDRARIINAYQESNERIRREYFPERKELFKQRQDPVK